MAGAVESKADDGIGTMQLKFEFVCGIIANQSVKQMTLATNADQLELVGMVFYQPA